MTKINIDEKHWRYEEITDILCEIRDRKMRQRAIQLDAQLAKALRA